MAHVATPFLDLDHTLSAQAALVLAVTARAWALAPRAAQVLARRPVLGCAPWRCAVSTGLRPVTVDLAHSW